MVVPGFTLVTTTWAAALERGLKVALFAIVIIVTVSLLGSNLSKFFNNVATSV